MSFTPFGRLARRVVGLRYAGWRFSGPEHLPEPAVFLVHHQNLAGPVRAMALLPGEPRLWVLSSFCQRKSCFEQYYRYTLTRRFGWPKGAAWPTAQTLSWMMPAFLRQFQVIPVWRGSMKIRDTLRQSNSALLRGESLLLCPDQDYASGTPEVGALYDGFLHLERPYFKAAGKHLAFIPLFCSQVRKELMAGTPVYLTGERPFSQEKADLTKRITAAMNEMGHRAGDI